MDVAVVERLVQASGAETFRLFAMKVQKSKEMDKWDSCVWRIESANTSAVSTGKKALDSAVSLGWRQQSSIAHVDILTM